MPPVPLLFGRHPAFNLNTAGVAGFFGGEEAISAMATVHLYKGRRFLGCFNSPGSYTVAKRFGTMANSRFWDGLFPGPNDSPAVSFELDGKKGPQYIAAMSGTTLQTGHLGYLAMGRSKDSELEEKDPKLKVTVIEGRETTPVDVAYLAMKPVKDDLSVQPLHFSRALLGLFPIVISVVTCVMCGVVYDWFSFSMILLGIISSGYASFVIGKGKLVIEYVKNPAPGVPPGHGVLLGEDGVVMVIKGEERDVNAITKGHFVLETDPKQSDEKWERVQGNKQVNEKKEEEEEDDDDADEGDQNDKAEEGKKQDGDSKKHVDKERKYHKIGISSLILLFQFLVQLLLVPQGTLIGQIMFLVSFCASWAYNSYLSSLEKEKIQTQLLFQTLGDPEMRRFRTGTRTSMTVFVCLLLFHEVERSSPEKDRELRLKILNKCIPNDTDVWMRWKEKVVQQLLDIDEALPCLAENDRDKALPKSDRRLLKVLLKDAVAAFRGYLEVRDGLPPHSTC